MKYVNQGPQTDDPYVDCQNERPLIEEYHNYIESVKDKLPPDVIRLCEWLHPCEPATLYMNDGNIRELTVNQPNGSVQIKLIGEAFDTNASPISNREITL